jgi:hypothetical protein
MNPHQLTPVVVDFDIGCQPSPSGCDEMVIQDGNFAFLIFSAVSTRVDPSTGELVSLGRALVECEEFVATKLGYPNDEGINEHPLWDFGLSSAETVAEAKNSPWVAELESQMLASRKRIWGNNPLVTFSPFQMRHFLVQLKETTFECVASNLKVIKYGVGLQEAVAYIGRRFDRLPE